MPTSPAPVRPGFDPFRSARLRRTANSTLRSWLGALCVGSSLLAGCSSTGSTPLPAGDGGGRGGGLSQQGGAAGAALAGSGGSSLTTGGAGQASTSFGGLGAGGGSSNSAGAAGSGSLSSGGASADGGRTGGASGGGSAGRAGNAGEPGNGGSGSAGGSTGGQTNAGGTPFGGRSGDSSGGRAGGTSGGNAASGGGAGAAGAPSGGPLTIWIAGDSTVQNCSSACPCGWGGQFQSLFAKDVSVVNSAIGGRSVRSWLYLKTLPTADADGECEVQKDASGNPQWSSAWSRMTGADGMKRGDYLFIQFGINDGARACNTSGAEGRHVGLAAFKSAYAMMAEAAKARGATAIFVTPVSMISCSGSTAQGSRGAYVTATLEAGREKGVPVIDLHQASVSLYNSLKFCPIPGGDNEASFGMGAIGDFFCKDHTHFEAQGAARIAGLVAQALRDQAHPLANYLK